MSRASIGNLSVVLSANTANYARGMQKAGRQTQQFSVNVERSIGRVFRTVSTLGTLVAGGGAIALFTGQLRRLDDAAKAAGRLSIATEELTRLQFAGEQTGVAITTMNMALQRMNRRIAEAAKGSGEAVKALTEDLNLDPVALSAMNTAEQFRTVAQAFKDNVGPVDRTRVAMKLFDSEGVALINTMAGGTAALDKFGETADRTGFTISSKAARSAERFSDSMNRLKASVGGAAAALTESIIPPIELISKRIEGLVKSLKSIDKITLKNQLQLAAMVAGATAGVALAPKIIKSVTRIVAALRSMAKAQAIALALTGPAGWATLAAGAVAAAAAVIAIEVAFESFSSTVQETSKNLETVVEKVDQVAALSDKIMDSFSGGSKHPAVVVTEKLSEGFRNVADSMADMESRAASIFESTRTPAERLARQVEEIANLTSLGLLEANTSQRAFDQLAQRQGQQLSSQSIPAPSTREVSFAALGARDAAGRKQDKIEKNTAEEVKISGRIDGKLGDLLKAQTNSQGAAITIARY